MIQHLLHRCERCKQPRPCQCTPKPLDDYTLGWRLIATGRRPTAEDSDRLWQGYLDAKAHYE